MSEQEWRGKWWVPDEPDVGVSGTPFCAEEGRLRLGLVGGFATESWTPLPGGDGTSGGGGERHWASAVRGSSESG